VREPGAHRHRRVAALGARPARITCAPTPSRVAVAKVQATPGCTARASLCEAALAAGLELSLSGLTETDSAWRRAAPGRRLRHQSAPAQRAAYIDTDYLRERVWKGGGKVRAAHGAGAGVDVDEARVRSPRAGGRAVNRALKWTLRYLPAMAVFAASSRCGSSACRSSASANTLPAPAAVLQPWGRRRHSLERHLWVTTVEVLGAFVLAPCRASCSAWRSRGRHDGARAHAVPRVREPLPKVAIAPCSSCGWATASGPTCSSARSSASSRRGEHGGRA
jgi:hypothetical protein